MLLLAPDVKPAKQTDPRDGPNDSATEQYNGNSEASCLLLLSLGIRPISRSDRGVARWYVRIAHDSALVPSKPSRDPLRVAAKLTPAAASAATHHSHPGPADCPRRPSPACSTSPPSRDRRAARKPGPA